jgi:type VI secretion system secreted protein VgrG
MISLFAQKLGIKLVSKGKIDIQSQADELLASALKDVTIHRSGGRLILTAAKEVWVGAGGSYLRINEEGIENGTPGDILEKCAYWGKQVPQFQSLATNQAEPTAFNERFCVQLPNGEAARHRAYVITRADGAEIHGTTDGEGMIALQQGLNVEGISIHFPGSNTKGSSV